MSALAAVTKYTIQFYYARQHICYSAYMPRMLADLDADSATGIQVGQHTFTDIDYADDVALLVDKEESFHTALAAMDEEASKFGLRVSWTKTKI